MAGDKFTRLAGAAMPPSATAAYYPTADCVKDRGLRGAHLVTVLAQAGREAALKRAGPMSSPPIPPPEGGGKAEPAEAG